MAIGRDSCRAYINKLYRALSVETTSWNLLKSFVPNSGIFAAS
jgi:hypothetical protein